ncbi:hypothetical protein NHX12_021710 [Muraenolepis orangiensis]|uniref:Sperm-associated antigen 16 protein n=1 Tax=Muraenolepis orangiensis TaxID=630683 RepID=A0A9Q0IWA4_9TELE|nr:hypothetical protein NHX12_021710 [Muraenolepis orangiensis]
MTTTNQQDNPTDSFSLGVFESIPVERQYDTRNTPEPVDDYLRNFLLSLGMTKTLACFQTEWTEMFQKGLLNTGLQVQGGDVFTQNHQPDVYTQNHWPDVVTQNHRPDEVTQNHRPDVYTQNHRLDADLRQAHRERDEYKSVASATADTLTGLQKARDFHRMQHNRLLQEKNSLIEGMKKLKVQCGRYEPAVTQITERYQSALKQKMLVSLERDKALAQLHRLRVETLHNNPSQPEESQRSLNQDTMQDARCKTKTKRSPSAQSPHLVDPPHIAGDSKFPAGNNLPLMKQRPVTFHGPTKAAAAAGFQLRSTIKAHSQPIRCLAHHPTKRLLASSSDDRLWKLWGLPEGDLVASGEGHTDWLSGISFHPDTTLLGTTGGDASVRIWDLSEGRLVLSLQGHSGVTWGCSFHPYGDFVASCSIDCTIKVWDLQSERCHSTLRGHKGSVNSVEFLGPGSNTLLSSSADKTLALWDARTSQCSQTIRGHTSTLNGAAVSPASSSIASCDSGGIVMLWDTRNLVVPTVVVETGPGPSNQVAFDPRGTMLAVAGDEGSARVMDLSTNRVVAVLRHEDSVQSVVFDHTGEHLLSGASDGQVYVWS